MGISFLSKTDSSTSTSCHRFLVATESHGALNVIHIGFACQCKVVLQTFNGLVVHLRHQMDGAEGDICQAEQEDTGLDTSE